MRHLALCFLAPCLIFAACDGAEDGPPSWDDAQIQPRGVEGVEFGMTRSQVIEIRGEPYETAYVPGRSSWRDMRYVNAEGRFLQSYLLNVQDPENDVVDAIVLYKWYEGKTAEGVGIGSSDDELSAVYGEPQRLLRISVCARA